MKKSFNFNGSKLKEFYKLCKLLNKQDICPLLFGSLGLEYITNKDLNSDDMDVLVPKIYLADKWEWFKLLIETKLKFKLIDLHEHTFERNNIKISFATIENLNEFVSIEDRYITKYFYNKTCFKVLNLKQYLKVYTKSKDDGYRQKKKNNADIYKIKLINDLLEENKKEINKFSFELAQIKDKKEIFNLYQQVIKSTLTTWDKNYPSKEMIKNDILNNELFVLKSLDNKIVGVVYITNKFETEDKGYKKHASNPFRFARICTLPALQGLGIGQKLVEKTIEYIKSNNGDAIRISVYKDNISAIKTYEKFNFIKTGEISKYGYDFYLYETKL